MQPINSTRLEKPYYSFFVRYIWLISALWTLVIGGSLFWNIKHCKQDTLKIASIHAQISYEKDLFYRRWNSIHGGVYVPATKDTPPNPYLSHVPERDIKTPSGKLLTLVNPAYMTRQVNELIKKEQGISGHITSLKPLRPENSPDSWEKKALVEFEQGKDMVMSVENIEGKNYYRIMHPFITEERCLKCHEPQGYKVGDVRGGISVSIPMAPLYAIQQERIKTLAIVHTLLWFLGISGLLFTRQRLKANEQKEHKLIAELKRLGHQQELILSTAGEGILGLDVHGNHTIVNPAAAQMLGYTVDELIGRHSHSTLHYKKADGSPYPEDECPIYAAFKDGRVHHITEEVFWKKDGTSFPVEYTSTPITEDEKIIGAVVTFSDISERKQIQEELRALSLIDELTGLYNRRGFLTLVKQQTKIANRMGQEMLLIFADIDKMKLINDTLGHKEGDRALIDTANILRKSLRHSDIISRFGGDEFVALAMEARDEHAEIINSSLQDNIKSHNEKEVRPYKLSLSLGFVCYVPGASIEELLLQADQLMYKDKQKKRVKSDEG